MISTILIIFQILGFLSSIYAILYTRTAQGAIAWVVSLNTLPLISVPAYWVFGRNKFNGYVAAWQENTVYTEEKVSQIRDGLQPYAAESPTSFPEYEAVKALAKIPFMNQNKVSLLKDGEQTYHSIAQGIEAAEHYILFQFYILRDDVVGNQFKDQLIRKAQQGVAVYILYDELGSKSLPSKWLKTFKENGIEILPFNTRKGRLNHFQLNFRNHRKIVVVDGKYAWLGGLNIGDDYLGHYPKLTPWRDTHMAIEGPAVLSAQVSFFLDWYWASRELLPKVTWEPHIAKDSNQHVLVLASGPADTLETASLFFTNLLNAARQRIWIATPYFIPDEATMTALRLALLKGIEVRIMTPRLNDNWFVKQAAHIYLAELAEHGAQIYSFEHGFMHQKVMLIDERLGIVGSANFDNRSFRLNFEVTGAVADEVFTSEVETMLREDLACSTDVTQLYLQKPTFWNRFKAKSCDLLAPIL